MAVSFVVRWSGGGPSLPRAYGLSRADCGRQCRMRRRNSNAMAFGDFAAGYTIAERPDLRILRRPSFSASRMCCSYATKACGVVM